VNPADPLLVLPNVVLAPHVAWLSTGTFTRSFGLAAENCRRITNNDTLMFRII